MINSTEPQHTLAEKTVDFLASTHAFREYLGKAPLLDAVLHHIPEHWHHFFHHRLTHYRNIYCPQG
ncbi:hypothetical protein TUM12370_20280 [Salmonella enterica subsp. enterica serovar Choleraesuis]|nr:hypothetical protein TUM12370_20280 [Salmonella enterica subsp. enterica serovar Choleraesuis]